MDQDRRAAPRREFGYYMPVMDGSTMEIVGYLADIGQKGVRMDTRKKLVVNKTYTFRLDLTPDVSDRPFIVFSGKVKWSHNDISDPDSFMAGLEIVSISHHDEKIFTNIIEKYGKQKLIWE